MAVKMTGKRSDYITWDEYFMGVAQLSALRSKDPNTQVGSCIVSKAHKILSMGYIRSAALTTTFPGPGRVTRLTPSIPS